MRKPANATVRLSVPVDTLTHARLRALAALRQVDASAIASQILRAGLARVVVRDGTEPESETPSG
jgi:hypothetical protein